MTIRESLEQMEHASLSPYATLSENSVGRDDPEPQCDIRPVFQRDRDRIVHSKAFRRLKNKTQVFLEPKGDHYRTRLSHTLEVSQNARTIARALRMNESLVEAIALGHDLGHTPFGHAGESVLNRLCTDGFKHNEQSVRIVEKLEKDGKGLNLTWEVRDGILNNHDIDDAIRGHILTEEDIPSDLRETLGYTSRERLNKLIHNIIMTSMDQNDIKMEPEIERAMQDLRQFMFVHVYTNPAAKGEESKAQELVERLFYFYMDHVEEIPEAFRRMLDEGEKRERVVCDYIAGMTDQYAIEKFKQYFVPMAWSVE